MASQIVIPFPARPKCADVIPRHELARLHMSQEMMEAMQEGFEQKVRAIAERIRRGAAIEDCEFRLNLKTLKVEED